MVKDCTVLLNGDLATVIKFGDVEVQLPPIGSDANMVRVAYENGTYRVVANDYTETTEKVATKTETATDSGLEKKDFKKKTTNDKSAK